MAGPYVTQHGQHDSCKIIAKETAGNGCGPMHASCSPARLLYMVLTTIYHYSFADLVACVHAALMGGARVLKNRSKSTPHWSFQLLASDRHDLF